MISQAEAAYTPLSGTALFCVCCSMFKGPNGCTLVEGPINPIGWCKFWEDKLKNHTEVVAVVEKDAPGVSDVHVPAAMSGDDKKKKRRDFSAFVSDLARKPSQEQTLPPALPVTTVTKKSINKASGSQISGTGVLQSVPDRKADDKPKKRGQNFSDILEVNKKAQALVGLPAAVNALHQASQFGQKPKRLRYGDKNYKLDIHKSEEEVSIIKVDGISKDMGEIKKALAVLDTLRRLGYDL